MSPTAVGHQRDIKQAAHSPKGLPVCLLAERHPLTPFRLGKQTLWVDAQAGKRPKQHSNGAGGGCISRPRRARNDLSCGGCGHSTRDIARSESSAKKFSLHLLGRGSEASVKSFPVLAGISPLRAGACLVAAESCPKRVQCRSALAKCRGTFGHLSHRRVGTVNFREPQPPPPG